MIKVCGLSNLSLPNSCDVSVVLLMESTEWNGKSMGSHKITSEWVPMSLPIRCYRDGWGLTLNDDHPSLVHLNSYLKQYLGEDKEFLDQADWFNELLKKINQQELTLTGWAMLGLGQMKLAFIAIRDDALTQLKVDDPSTEKDMYSSFIQKCVAELVPPIDEDVAAPEDKAKARTHNFTRMGKGEHVRQNLRLHSLTAVAEYVLHTDVDEYAHDFSFVNLDDRFVESFFIYQIMDSLNIQFKPSVGLGHMYPKLCATYGKMISELSQVPKYPCDCYEDGCKECECEDCHEADCICDCTDCGKAECACPPWEGSE